MRQGRKKRKKKNVLSLSTGQGRDEVCRALHRTDARAFHKNTLEYSYRTIISRFRSPTLYILLACYIVYPDFFFPFLFEFRVSNSHSFVSFLISATAIDRRRTVGTNRFASITRLYDRSSDIQFILSSKRISFLYGSCSRD